MLTGLQRIQVFQIPNQHFNKLSATKLWVHSRWWWALRFCYHLWFWWEGVARIHRSDSESTSAAIYDPDGEELEEYTNSDSDSESEGAVLDEGCELHGENYDPVSDAEHDGYYWDD
jgi:hypothetical protein